jgi:hypothetical protein
MNDDDVSGLIEGILAIPDAAARDVLDRLVVKCEQQKAPRMTRSAERRAEPFLRLRLCRSDDPNYTVNISQTGLGSAELRDSHRPLPNRSADMPGRDRWLS